MLRHDFQPGRAVLGLTLLGAVAVYAADVAGEWDTPWWAPVPLVACGLVVATVVGAVGYGVRLRRRARIASTENTDAPASTSGSHPIR